MVSFRKRWLNRLLGLKYTCTLSQHYPTIGEENSSNVLLWCNVVFLQSLPSVAKCWHYKNMWLVGCMDGPGSTSIMMFPGTAPTRWYQIKDFGLCVYKACTVINTFSSAGDQGFKEIGVSKTLVWSNISQFEYRVCKSLWPCSWKGWPLLSLLKGLGKKTKEFFNGKEILTKQRHSIGLSITPTLSDTTPVLMEYRPTSRSLKLVV